MERQGDGNVKSARVNRQWSVTPAGQSGDLAVYGAPRIAQELVFSVDGRPTHAFLGRHLTTVADGQGTQIQHAPRRGPPSRARRDAAPW